MADPRRSRGGDIPAPQNAPAAARGTVRFLDAIPADEPVAVEADVLTPHVKPYYDGAATGQSCPTSRIPQSCAA